MADRAVQLHRREAKATRRRKRIANGKRRHSHMRGLQLAARLVQAHHNLESLGAMAGIRREGFSLSRFIKPKLRHIRADVVLDATMIDRLMDGSRPA